MITDSELTIHPSTRIVVFAFVLFLLFAGGLFSTLVHLRLNLDVSREIVVLYWRIAVAIGAVWLGYITLRVRTTKLVLNKDHLTKISGIIVKTYSRVEVNRISNYFAKRGILSLLLGLIDISIDTPGGQGPAEVSVRYINLKEAQNFLEMLRQLRSGVTVNTPI